MNNYMSLERLKRQQGAAIVEYTLVTAVIAAALLTPVNDQGVNAIGLLIDAFKQSHAHYIHGMSYPTAN